MTQQSVTSTKSEIKCPTKGLKTNAAIQAAFDAAVKSNAKIDITLGYVGGSVVGKDGKKHAIQVGIVRTKNGEIHIVGEKGKGYDVKSSSIPENAIIQARALLKSDSSLAEKGIDLPEPCLKAPIVKVGARAKAENVGNHIRVLSGTTPKFMPIFNSDGKFTHYIALYKTNGKDSQYAIGLRGGDAVIINAKVSEGEKKLAAIVTSVVNFESDANGLKKFLKGFNGSNIEKYSTEEVPKDQRYGADKKAQSSKDSAVAAKTVGYAIADEHEASPLGRFEFAKDTNGKPVATRLYVSGKKIAVLSNTAGGIIFLKTTRDNPNVDKIAAKEVLSLYNKKDPKVSVGLI